MPRNPKTPYESKRPSSCTWNLEAMRLNKLANNRKAGADLTLHNSIFIWHGSCAHETWNHAMVDRRHVRRLLESGSFTTVLVEDRCYLDEKRVQ